jgi:phosphoribosylaminoimidazole-succinocarboxamide synthase
MPALENTNMPKLKLIAKGKVRDIYALPDQADSDKLLFVATDRISAFDIIMVNVRHNMRTRKNCSKAKVLTADLHGLGYP